MTIYEKRLEADIVELVSALKFATEIIGHPDDDASKYFASVLAKYTFKPVDMTQEDMDYTDYAEYEQRRQDATIGFDND